MKKIITILLMTLTLNATEINWIESYTKASQVAKAENKPMLVFINRPDCGACEMMKEVVFKDKIIYPYINEHFIPVALNINKNDAPKELQSRMTPTFQFVKHDGSKIRETLVGGKTGVFFLNILKKSWCQPPCNRGLLKK